MTPARAVEIERRSLWQLRTAARKPIGRGTAGREGGHGFRSSCSTRFILATVPIRLLLAFTFDKHQKNPAFCLALGRSCVASGPPCRPTMTNA